MAARKRWILSTGAALLVIVVLGVVGFIRLKNVAEHSTCHVPGCAMTLVDTRLGLTGHELTYRIVIPARIGLPITGHVDVRCEPALPFAAPACTILRQSR